MSAAAKVGKNITPQFANVEHTIAWFDIPE
jgi:hypothetical protein